MKIVNSGFRPLDDAEAFQRIKVLAVSQEWIGPAQTGQLRNISAEARQSYADKVLSFVDVAKLRRLKVQGAPVEFVRVHHEPDSTFPNSIPPPSCQRTTPPPQTSYCARARTNL